MKKDIYKSTFGLGDVCQRTQGTTTQPSSHTTGIMKGITIQKRKYMPRIKCYIKKDRQLMSGFIWAHTAEAESEWQSRGRRSQQKAESSHLKPQAHAEHELEMAQDLNYQPTLLTHLLQQGHTSLPTQAAPLETKCSNI